MKLIALALASLLGASCVHGSTWEDFGLAATDGVIGGLTYAVAERMLAPAPAPAPSSTDGGSK